jgi:hypothetical protein
MMIRAARTSADAAAFHPRPARWGVWARCVDLVSSATAIYALGALLAGLALAHVAAFYHDDAFISLRYAARLLAGEGLTWNPGERIEGFTNPLWLAQVSALGALGMDLQTASRLLGVAYFAALFVLWARSGAAPLFLLIVATQPGLVLWSVSGLETTGFSFWLALGAWLTWQAGRAPAPALRPAALAGVALGAAALTRPEGLGAGVVALAYLAARRRWTATAAALVTFGLLAGSYELFRLAYFRDPLPNTAYAKLGGLPLGTRLLAAFEYLRNTVNMWSAAVLAAAVGLVAARRRRPLVMLLIASPVLLSLLLAGGDHMPAARLTVPVVVVVVFAAAIAGRHGFWRPYVVSGLVMAATAGQIAALLMMTVERDPAAVIGEHVGRYLQTHLPQGALVATATAGSTPYFAPSLRFIDTLGLNDPHIARRRVATMTTRWQHVPGHLKGDGDYVLRRAPDVIILGPASGFLGAPPTDWFLTDFELLQSAEFRARYQPFQVVVRISPQQLEARPLPNRLDRNHFLVADLYLRIDSPAAQELAGIGFAVPSADVPHP